MLTCTSFFVTHYVLPIAGGDALEVRPVRKSQHPLEPHVFSSRTFQDTCISCSGVVIILSGSHQQSRAARFSELLDRILIAKPREVDMEVLNSVSTRVWEALRSSGSQLRALSRQIQ